ncbi:hypothetical protein B296_00054725 [Ensete ventricosum]|uniref:Pentatricopeptide repeat-containing protein n=1 Tax=Ensete ventricosum TaxID=4639 RepID=A0A426XQ94_ENSVE|nr:hypothetical protein B296_00054725 [Ensete ventricosum]
MKPPSSLSPRRLHLSLIGCSGLKQARQIHAHLISLGLVCYTYVTSRVLALYALHDMALAHHLFARIPHPTIFNWNTMIRGFSNTARPHRGLAIYVGMRRHDVFPNMHTFPFTIKSCTSVPVLSQVHGHVFKFGFDLDVFVTSSLVKRYSDLGAVGLASKVFDESSHRNVVCWTSLITGYCSHALVDKARSLFDHMPERNGASWSAMITGYVQNECHKEAIELFHELRECSAAELNDALLVSALSACASLGALEEGRWIHSHIDAKGSTHYGLELGTALVDFYAKCGFVDSARDVFDKLPRKDVTAWSAMIMGLALNGLSRPAISVFSEMLKQGVAPNAITFVGVLAACNHGGLVEEGRAHFESMVSAYGVRPTIEHYGCMVDLLSRAGHTAEAEGLIESMPMEPDGVIWGALLNGCRMHGHFKRAEQAGRRVIELEPTHFGRYVGLANVYASMKRWDGVAELRRAMRKRQVTITPGWSSIGHLDDKTHRQKETRR